MSETVIVSGAYDYWLSSSPHQDGETETFGFPSPGMATGFRLGIEYTNDSHLRVERIEFSEGKWVVYVVDMKEV